MLSRCFYTRATSYAYYGGRGITVCAEWVGDGGFERFLAHMGSRPEGTSLDRIDSNGNYEPGNVRWADKRTQHENRNVTPFTYVKATAHRRERKMRKIAHAALKRFGRVLGFRATERLMREIHDALEEQFGPPAPMRLTEIGVTVEEAFICGDFGAKSEHFGDATWISLVSEMKDPFPPSPRGNYFSKADRRADRVARRAA
jgi:hypothetical protein